MRIDIVEAKPFHCGQMARALRDAQRDGVVARDLDAHRELRRRLEESAWRRACLLDGRLAALGGVLGTQLESEGYVWLAIAQWATRHARALLRAARVALAELSDVRHRIETLILIEDAASFRFAEHLGFVVRRTATLPFEMIVMEREL